MRSVDSSLRPGCHGVLAGILNAGRTSILREPRALGISVAEPTFGDTLGASSSRRCGTSDGPRLRTQWRVRSLLSTSRRDGPLASGRRGRCNGARCPRRRPRPTSGAGGSHMTNGNRTAVEAGAQPSSQAGLRLNRGWSTETRAPLVVKMTARSTERCRPRNNGRHATATCPIIPSFARTRAVLLPPP
jgi:hypothetical protein